MAEAMMNEPRSIPTSSDLSRFIEAHGDARVRAMTDADRVRLADAVSFLNLRVEKGRLTGMEAETQRQREFIERRVAPSEIPAPANAFTLRHAFDQAWKPAADPPKNTLVEVGRYVDEFIALNGELDLKKYERSHWTAWRADCLEKHGPGWTAFKWFTMMKTICSEAIRAGLFARKDFAGQDIVMKKPARSKLRNEGWRPDEIKKWFSAPVFQGVKDSPHPDVDYWAAVIIAYTGATVIEVANMNTADVAERHGYWTFRLWRKKSENSDRIIPIPKQVLDLGFLAYVKTCKAGPLFTTATGKRISNKLISQTFSRMRAAAGITRRGADAHAYRHHITTILPDLGCPDRISDYITGHAPPNVGRTYGETELSTAKRFLDQVDLGIVIPKMEAVN